MNAIRLVNHLGHLVTALSAAPLPINRGKVSKAAAQLAHLIIIADRSGSMYYDITALREMVLKLLTLEEYRDSSLLVSLVSYSSSGDARVHFTRLSVADIMAPGSTARRQIESLQATALTCISGGLQAAEKLVQPGERTAIALHTDGYANDPSPRIDRAALDASIDRLSKNPQVFVNTVAYNSADFTLLDALASRGGGVCVQARSAAAVYDALHKMASTMAGSGEPALHLSAPGEFIVGVSKSAGKIVSGQDELFVRGLKASDDFAAWSIGTHATDVNASADPLVNLVYARALLAAGKLNEAKQAMLGARAVGLYSHMRALTSAQIAAFATALDGAIFSDGKIAVAKQDGLPNSAGPSVLEVVSLLRSFAGNFEIDRASFMHHYRRRGEKRVAGEWVDGKLVTEPYYLEPDTKDPWVKVTSIDQNESEATVNFTIAVPSMLVSAATGEVISKLAGETLKLSTINSLTVVGDGSVTVDYIDVKTADKRLLRALEGFGFHVSEQTARIPLADMPVMGASNVGEELLADSDIVTKLANCKTVVAILEAATKGESTKYTAEQIGVFKAHCLSANLNFNPRTTTQYPPGGRDEYIREGKLDAYTRYSISMGTTTLPFVKLRSGNELLSRFIEVSVSGGGKMKEPKLPLLMQKDVVTAKKTLSAQTKLTAADDMQRPWIEGFVSARTTQKSGPWLDFLKLAGVSSDQCAEFVTWGELTKDAMVELFTAIAKKVSEYRDLLFSQVVAPTVMYTGSTGFLPECISSIAIMKTAEQMTTDHKVKISDADSDATFFVLPDKRVLSVCPETAWYTTGR